MDAHRTWTRAEVAAHNTARDLYVIIENVVYDVTRFLHDHPGGPGALLQQAGGDATRCFRDVGHSEAALRLRSTFEMGELAPADRWEEPEPAALEPDDVETLSLRSVLSACGAPMMFAALATLLYMYMFS